MLAVRRLPGFRREVLVFDGDSAPARNPMLRRARADEWQNLERFRAESDVDPDPASLAELAGPAQQGLVWVLEGQDGVAGMFRIDGVSRRRVQLADAFVHPSFRGRGLGTSLMKSAAHVARNEYARGAVETAVLTPAADRTAKRAGFVQAGPMEDIRLA
jgi:GNAT superfamily N-acetyltransferase